MNKYKHGHESSSSLLFLATMRIGYLKFPECIHSGYSVYTCNRKKERYITMYNRLTQTESIETKERSSAGAVDIGTLRNIKFHTSYIEKR